MGKMKELSNTKVYIAGPMTGIEEHNFPAFNEAAQRYRSYGLEVFNPAENDGGSRDKDWSFYMHLDLPQLLQCDCIVVLPGWEDSDGASIEVFLAQKLKKPVYKYKNVGHPLSDIIEPDRMSLHRADSHASPNLIAHKLVHGDRRKAYGHPADDYKRTAALITALIKHKLKPEESVTATDAIMFMILVKLSREMNAHKDDNIVDICGYSECLDLVVKYAEATHED